MLLTSCRLISLGTGFDLFNLPLTSSDSRNYRGMPCTFQAPLYDSMCYVWSTFLASCAGHPRVRISFVVCHLVYPHVH